MKAVSETTNTHADITCLDLNNFPIKIMNRQSRTVFRCLRQFLCVIIYVLLTKEYNVFFFLPKKWSRPFLLLSVILALDKYRYLEMNISANRRVISKSFKRFTEKNRTWFFHSDRSFSVLLLQDPFRKHDSFGKSPVAWRNLAATHIFLCPSRDM